MRYGFWRSRGLNLGDVNLWLLHDLHGGRSRLGGCAPDGRGHSHRRIQLHVLLLRVTADDGPRSGLLYRHGAVRHLPPRGATLLVAHLLAKVVDHIRGVVSTVERLGSLAGDGFGLGRTLSMVQHRVTREVGVSGVEAAAERVGGRRLGRRLRRGRRVRVSLSLGPREILILVNLEIRGRSGGASLPGPRSFLPQTLARPLRGAPRVFLAGLRVLAEVLPRRGSRRGSRPVLLVAVNLQTAVVLVGTLGRATTTDAAGPAEPAGPRSHGSRGSPSAAAHGSARVLGADLAHMAPAANLAEPARLAHLLLLEAATLLDLALLTLHHAVLELRELVLEPLRGLGAHEDAAVVNLASLLERAADLEERRVGFVEQGVTLADVVCLEELEYIVRFLTAVGVLDPDAEVSHVVPVARNLLKLAGASLEEGKNLRLASTGRERLLRPLDEPHPHLERVVAVVRGDGVPKGASFLFDLRRALAVAHTRGLVEHLRVAPFLQGLEVLLGGVPRRVRHGGVSYAEKLRAAFPRSPARDSRRYPQRATTGCLPRGSNARTRRIRRWRVG
mmetsp:Transcript_1577/g.7011  ORF Transcript_1577/g.7011 Transcript_1577/m.7011 type:complete len:559 (-) Transcript_1577:54-1730(-)